jgi:selenocysteine lyase/cysteine desulfurase
VSEVLPLYASVHRGAGYLSQVSTALYESSRQTIATFVGAREDDVAIITRNTTDALNLLARCVPDGGRVLVLDLEHHANLLPWQRGAATVLPIEDTVEETLAALAAELARVPYVLVAATGASNVTGEALPVDAVVALAHDAGARVVVDGAQLVPHRGFSLAETGADYVAFSGHKTYAPFGVGALIGQRDWLDDAPAYLAGGGAVREVLPGRTVWTTAPARHEAGSPNVIGAIALAEACEALASLPAGALAAHEDGLRTRLVEGLSAIDGVDVLRIWPDSAKPVGVVTFNVVGHDPGLVAAYLAAEHGIGVRDGRFCAHPLLARLGAPRGALRASVGVGTELETVERLIFAVQAYLSTGLTAHYVVVDGCWAVADDPRPLIQVHGLLGLAAQAAACAST